jgi:hypothetical protein
MKAEKSESYEVHPSGGNFPDVPPRELLPARINATATNFEASFKRLLGICRALRLAERGDLAQKLEPNAGVAAE